MAIERFTIARNDEVYECFPHMCRLASGRIMLTYRESNGHVASEYCRLIVRYSDDAGHSWSERQVIRDELPVAGVLQVWNCPKIQQLKDGRVLLLCDTYAFPPGEWSQNMSHCHMVLWLSTDDGIHWSTAQPTTVLGICPDQISEMDDGRWLLPSNMRSENTGLIVQNIATSLDQGDTWSQPVAMFDAPGYELDEVSIVVLPSGQLVAYLRDDSGRPLQKMISRDGGFTWDGPYNTLNPAAIGMPIAGLTQDGLILITSRYGLPSCWRVDIDVETWKKRIDRRTIVIPKVPVNNDFIGGITTSDAVRETNDEIIIGAGGTSVHTFAYIEPVASALAPAREDQKGLLLPLDLDANNLGADSGYTGWVEYERGKFLVANYINDDAPLAQIRGYRFSLEDF